MILHYFFYAIVLFLLLRLTAWFIKVLPVPKVYHNMLIKSYPLVEFFVWVLFAYFVAGRLFKEAQYYEVLLLIITLVVISFVSWFFIRDFIAGIFIKSENLFEKGKKIKIEHIEGFINHVGYRTVEIKTDDGSLVKVPFSKLSSGVISFPGNENDILYKHSFSINQPKNKAYPEYIANIRFLLLNSPWVAVTKEPHIELTDTTPSNYTFKIEFHALSEAQALKCEVMLKKAFKEKEEQ